MHSAEYISKWVFCLICRQILLASEVMVCVGILLSFNVIVKYTVPQYVISGLVMFVSAEVLEGKTSIIGCVVHLGSATSLLDQCDN